MNTESNVAEATPEIENDTVITVDGETSEQQAEEFIKELEEFTKETEAQSGEDEGDTDAENEAWDDEDDDDATDTDEIIASDLLD